VFIAATVFDGIRRRLGVQQWLMFDNGGGGLQQWAWSFDGGVIGHGILAGTYLAEYRDSLK